MACPQRSFLTTAVGLKILLRAPGSEAIAGSGSHLLREDDLGPHQSTRSALIWYDGSGTSAGGGKDLTDGGATGSEFLATYLPEAEDERHAADETETHSEHARASDHLGPMDRPSSSSPSLVGEQQQLQMQSVGNNSTKTKNEKRRTAGAPPRPVSATSASVARNAYYRTGPVRSGPVRSGPVRDKC